MKFEDLTGVRFTRLIVIARAESNKYGHTRWSCLCDCGNTIIALAMDLKRGGRPSCGCLKSEKISALRKLAPGQAGLNQLFGQYRKSAKERGFTFSLTITQFADLVDKKCHYCGAESYLKVFGQARMEQHNCNGNFIYTGIDRKDSNKGYQIENCVTCCKTCNFAKNDMSYEAFMEYLDKLTVFRSKLIVTKEII